MADVESACQQTFRVRDAIGRSWPERAAEPGYSDPMGTLHIGAAGELLVQYRLLKLGIDSGRLTTDAGVDLVAYSPKTGEATTIQVKTVQKPTPAGGRGRLAIGWYFPHELKADLLAVALLSTDTVWLFTRAEAQALAQQHSTHNIRRLYWYTDETAPPKSETARRASEMTGYLLEARAKESFPS